jgi:hypothetical protein
MTAETSAPLPARDASAAVARLIELMTDLARDLEEDVWVPGPLERSLARRLVVACAGDGELTPARVRTTLVEGSVALTYAGDGRLARLFAQLTEVTTYAARDVSSADVLDLLEQVAASHDEESAGH